MKFLEVPWELFALDFGSIFGGEMIVFSSWTVSNGIFFFFGKSPFIPLFLYLLTDSYIDS